MKNDKRKEETTEPKNPGQAETENVSNDQVKPEKEEKQKDDDEDEGYVIMESGLGINE